jgi:WD40 repeat protein
VAFSPDGRRALSGSLDKTVRLWEVESGHAVRLLEGHSDSVESVAFSPDGRRALSAAENGVMRVWDVTEAAMLEVLPGEKRAALGEAQVQYTNAKVVLVGETGVGKTGLSIRLARNEW